MRCDEFPAAADANLIVSRMTDSTCSAPTSVIAWVDRQAPEVRDAIHAAVDFATDGIVDAVPGEPVAGSIDCMRRMAELDIALPSAAYFEYAHDLLGTAGTVALEVGLAHCRTENELRVFLALAGTALLADQSAIRRFESGFGPQSAYNQIVAYLQAELEMLDGGFPGE